MEMIEVRFHGRGGQGSVTAVRILAKAFVLEGKYSSSFPDVPLLSLV
jgi:pyruvate ferredoxin oxidoreductase gamma subunit